VTTDPRDIILRPVVSEKSYGSMDFGVFTFVVAPTANKVQIRQAIEALDRSLLALLRERQQLGQQAARAKIAAAVPLPLSVPSLQGMTDV